MKLQEKGGFLDDHNMCFLEILDVLLLTKFLHMQQAFPNDSKIKGGGSICTILLRGRTKILQIPIYPHSRKNTLISARAEKILSFPHTQKNTLISALTEKIPSSPY